MSLTECGHHGNFTFTDLLISPCLEKKLDDYLNKVLVDTRAAVLQERADGCPGLLVRELLSRGWRRERVSGWTVFVGTVHLGDWSALSETGLLRRRAPSGLEEKGRGGYLSLEQAVGRTMGLQEEGLQGDDGSAAFQEGLVGRVDKARSGRRCECHGSWQLVRMESEDA